ncbi:MAG: hypothetical protein QM831_42140 [Kofleriaceae bacterium]
MADEETRAKAILGEMQARLSQGPHTALGLSGNGSTPEEVRGAFLNLTKQFHPARFGRMSNETQRLSNEVFLGIKAAHDQLLKAAGGLPRGGRTNASGAMPVLTAEGSTKTPTRPIASGTKHGTGVKTPPFGVRVVPQPTPPTPAPQPVNHRQGTPPPATQRPGTPPIVARPPTPVTKDPETTRGTGEWNALAKPAASGSGSAPAFDERAEMKAVNAQLDQKNWGAAKSLLNGLAARVPTSKQYRALIAYTRGREAQQAGQQQDALSEFQRALQLDPDLQPAKSAMAELLRPRR